MLTILMNMYSSISSAVRIGIHERTNYFEGFSGVRQGCILSPLLFSLYVSELEHMLRFSGTHGIELLSNDERTHVLMYADDMCLLSDNIVDMQRKIYCLQDFCKKWGLSVNLEKTKMTVFSNGGTLKRAEKWYFGGKPINISTYYSYLGVIFSSRLIWTNCIESLCSKASRLVSRVRSLCRRYDAIEPNILFNIFDVKIKPLLLYGCEIWGVRISEQIEKVHVQFCKAVLNIGKTTPNCLALSECGRFHLFVSYQLRAMKFWLRVDLWKLKTLNLLKMLLTKLCLR